MEVLLAHPGNFFDSLKIAVISIEWELRWWCRCKPALKLWMCLFDYIKYFLECQSMRRRKDDSFLVILVRLAVQSSDMCPSTIAEVDISRIQGITTSREEQIVYYESGRNDFEIGLWKGKKFGREWTVDV